MALPQIAFQSEEEQNEIFKRGMEALRLGKISPKALVLGKKYRKKIGSAFCPNIEIRYISERVGHGVFAKSPMKKRSYVGEYTGIVRENIKIYFAPLNNYCYEYPIPDRIGRSFVIDATDGNFTRYINHSYNPNLKPQYAFFDGFYHLIFVALKEIQIGEQLTYDYGHNYWLIREPPESLS